MIDLLSAAASALPVTALLLAALVCGRLGIRCCEVTGYKLAQRDVRTMSGRQINTVFWAVIAGRALIAAAALAALAAGGLLGRAL